MNEVEAVKSVVALYLKTVDELDFELVRAVWLDAPETSFIHPRGHETGRTNIISSFYQETMGKFSKRELKPRDVSVHILGDTAVVVFYWDFYATFRSDGSTHETHGRETQVLVKDNGNWKITHVHYSNMPVTGEREGF